MTVSKTGKVTIKGSGKATITVKANATGNCLKAKTKKIKVTVYPYTYKKKSGRIKVKITDPAIRKQYQMKVTVNGKVRKDPQTGNTVRTLSGDATISGLKKGNKVVISIKTDNEKKFLKETIKY